MRPLTRKPTVHAPPPVQYPADAWELLSPSLTAARRERMLATAARRTRYLRLVIQDVHQPHNVSACMRSAEAFGVQDVDVVHLDARFKPSTAAKGVNEWLTIRRHRQVGACIESLRAAGYRIIAGVPPSDGVVSLYDMPVDRPLAVIFGNEHAGIHPEWEEHIDQRFTIPMYGMVESFNISVSAAITLAHLTQEIRTRLDPSVYLLDEAQRLEVMNSWVCRQLRSYEEQLVRLRQAPKG